MELFGFKIQRKDKVDAKDLESIAPPLQDGSVDITQPGGMAGSYSHWINWESAARDERELIRDYRSTALLTETSYAIDEIVNEAIVVDNEHEIVEIQLDETKFSKAIKNKMAEEFEYILGLLNFHNCADQIFRQWYIDGKQYYHVVVETDKEKEGIQALNWLDPKSTQKIREFIVEKDATGSVDVIKGTKEYFIYNPEPDPNVRKRGSNTTFQMPDAKHRMLTLSPESVIYTTSGHVDLETGRVLSFLHKAIKPANQLAMLEDATVVYRLVRAPERRVFYVDTGKMGSSRAEQYVQKIMNTYRNSLVYDTATGSVDANKSHFSMMEDIWLPRMEGGRGTEVDTLEGGKNLGEIEDVLYFRRRLYKALNVPVSRMDSDAGFSIGAASEVSREEIKFTKFVDGCLRRFNNFFYDLVKTQCLLKGIITEEDWEENKDKIYFQYNKDSYFSELKRSELLTNRLELLSLAESYANDTGYFSKTWIRNNVLNMNEDDVKSILGDWKTESEAENVDPFTAAVQRGDATVSVTGALVGQDDGALGVAAPEDEVPKKETIKTATKSEDDSTK